MDDEDLEKDRGEITLGNHSPSSTRVTFTGESSFAIRTNPKQSEAIRANVETNAKPEQSLLSRRCRPKDKQPGV